MKVLSILSSGYRATLEEQDDTVLWISQALRRAGADVDLLLRNSSVNYVVENQRVAPLGIGGRTQQNAPDVGAQLRDLVGSGAALFVLKEDLHTYGLSEGALPGEVRIVGSSDLPQILTRYDQVWHW